MPIVDLARLKVIERLPGWRGRFMHSEHMTVAHYEFDAGASIHEHFHEEEEVYEVLDGEIEVVIEGVTHRLKPGLVAVVPANARHSVRALSNGRVVIVDSPARPGFGS